MAEERKENEVPLLAEEEVLYPNCPGCKCAHLSAKGAGPPVRELFLVSTVVVCNALPISSLYPFLYFMVEDFQIAKTTEDIGYYAGAIGSIFMFGRFMSSVHWGIFADKYGRRSVMFLGLISIIILQPLFGIARGFWLAFFTRFFLGVFNGMLGPLKAYASELCNAENQAWGLTAVSTSWSLAMVIGPALGGFLARPAVNFPYMFSEDSLFARYPYLLPSLFQAGFAAIEMFVLYFLPETIHIHDEEHSSDVEQSLAVTKESDEESLWLNWPLMSSVIVYCVWSLHEICFTEIFSFWCVSSPETGGLGLSTSDVGVILSISGFMMLCAQMSIFPVLANYLGPIRVTRIPAIMVIPLVVLFPFMSLLHGKVEWLVLNVLSVLRNTLSVFATTGSFLLVNNAVASEKRGAANGISLSCVSLFRAVGPAAAGAIFSWGQSRHNAKFLPGSQMVFVILDLISIVAVFTMIPPFLPPEVDKPYSEIDHKEEKSPPNKSLTP